MQENNHTLGIKLPKISKYCVGVQIYIDRERINAIGLYMFNKDGRRASELDEMDLEFNVMELEVRDIEDIAVLMNEETFNKFCELWRGFHNGDKRNNRTSRI